MIQVASLKASPFRIAAKHPKSLILDLFQYCWYVSTGKKKTKPSLSSFFFPLGTLQVHVCIKPKHDLSRLPSVIICCFFFFQLIQCKADTNAVNEHGNTPLHYACFWGQNQVADVGAPPSGDESKMALKMLLTVMCWFFVFFCSGSCE